MYKRQELDFGRQGQYRVRVAPCIHKVPCVGYAFSEVRRRLRPELERIKTELVGTGRASEFGRRMADRRKAGEEVEERYYRRSCQRGDALLLGALRVMHLHLLNPGSDVLVYLIQLPGAVIVVQLGPHTHLDHTPPGRAFRTDHIRRAALRIPAPPPAPAEEDGDDRDG